MARPGDHIRRDVSSIEVKNATKAELAKLRSEGKSFNDVLEELLQKHAPPRASA